MNKKDLTENPVKRGLVKGFKAGQAGGALGPDAAEKFIKGIFTKEPDEKPAKDSSPKVAKSKEQPKATAIRDFNNIPDMLSFKDDKSGMLYTYDKKQRMWNSRDGKTTLEPKQGAVAYNQAKEKSKLESKDVTMKKNVKEGLADLAQRAEHDHEVQMARADLYKIAKYAIKLHEMLKSVSEAEGLEGWQQAKITKASDYISAVYHNLDYDMKFNGAGELGEGKISRKKQNEADSDNDDTDELPFDPDETPSSDKDQYGNTIKHKSKHLARKGMRQQMAAKHASTAESNDTYKTTLAKRLEEKFKK